MVLKTKFIKLLKQIGMKNCYANSLTSKARELVRIPNANNALVEYLGNGVIILAVEFNTEYNVYTDIYRSSDYGLTWSKVYSTYPNFEFATLQGISNIGNGEVAITNGGNDPYILRSTDYGRTWTAIDISAYYELKSYGINSIVKFNNIYYADCNGLSAYYTSTDFYNWTRHTFPSNPSNTRSESGFSVIGDKIYLSGDTGLYYSTDGSTWTSVSYPSSNIYGTVPFTSDGSNIYTIDDEVRAILKFDGTNITVVGYPFGLILFQPTLINTYNSNEYLVDIKREYEELWRYDLKNKTWNFMLRVYNANEYMLKIATPQLNTYVISTNRGIYSSLDNGQTWNYYSASISGGKIFSDGSIVIVTNKNSNVIYRSTNLGLSWSTVSLPTYFTDIISIGGTYYALGYLSGAQKTLYTSTDFGATWNSTPTIVYGDYFKNCGNVIVTTPNYYDAHYYMSYYDFITWNNVDITARRGLAYDATDYYVTSHPYIIGIDSYNKKMVGSNNFGSTWTTISFPSATSGYQLYENYVICNGIYYKFENGNFITLTPFNDAYKKTNINVACYLGILQRLDGSNQIIKINNFDTFDFEAIPNPLPNTPLICGYDTMGIVYNNGSFIIGFGNDQVGHTLKGITFIRTSDFTNYQHIITVPYYTSFFSTYTRKFSIIPEKNLLLIPYMTDAIGSNYNNSAVCLLAVEI